MSRPLRIQYNGAWYHVMNRGAGRKPIFRHRKHRLLFLEILEEIVETYKIEIHAYCLMGNHNHLLVLTPFGNLSEAMQRLGSTYTIRYNKSQKTDGALFRGRYKAKLVQDNHYVLHLVRYIHLNPLQAGIVHDLENYEWSSYTTYLGLAETPSWLTLNHTKSHFSSHNFIDLFRQFTFEDQKNKIENFFSLEKNSDIIGENEFINEIKLTIKYQSLSPEIADRKILRPLLIEIFEIVSIVFNKPISKVQNYRRDSQDARNCAMLITKKHFGYKLREICDMIGIKCYQTVSAAVYRFESRIKQDKAYREKYFAASQSLKWTEENSAK